MLRDGLNLSRWIRLECLYGDNCPTDTRLHDIEGHLFFGTTILPEITSDLTLPAYVASGSWVSSPQVAVAVTVPMQLVTASMEITAGAKVTANTRAYVITARSIGLQLNRKVEATKNAVTISGTSSSLRTTKIVQATTRTVSISAKSSVLSNDHPLVAGQVSVSITSTQASGSCGKLVVGTLSAIQVTTQSITANASHILSAVTDTMAVTMFDASVRADGVGLVTLRGIVSIDTVSTSMKVARSLSETSVVVPITANQGALSVSRYLSCSLASVSADTMLTALGLSLSVTGSTTACLVAGKSATIKAVRSLAATVQTVSIPAQVAILQATRFLRGDTLALAVTIPFLEFGKGSPPVTGISDAMAVVTYMATIRKTSTFVAQKATVNITSPGVPLGLGRSLIIQASTMAVTESTVDLSATRIHRVMASNIVATIIPASMLITRFISGAGAALNISQRQVPLNLNRRVSAIKEPTAIVVFPMGGTTGGLRVVTFLSERHSFPISRVVTTLEEAA